MDNPLKALHPLLQRVELLIDKALASDVPLLDATNRSLREAPGKMIRPALVLLSAGAAGSVCDDSFLFAAAAELLHNATLLHDDVVDSATIRRGRATVSSILGGPASVLIGDFWLVKCMSTVLSASRGGNQAIHIFSKTLEDLAEGEMLQLQKASDGDTTEEDYLRIIYCKTASLFEASALAGALSAGASPEKTEALAAYARNIGLAFQIKDDIFDYQATDSLGKPSGQDIKEGKITLPLLDALASVIPSAAAGIREKVRAVADNPSLAGELRTFVLEHDGIARAGQKLDFYVGEAISSLAVLEDSEEKSYLVQLARYMGSRQL